jgi:cytochrome c peroxidase
MLGAVRNLLFLAVGALGLALSCAWPVAAQDQPLYQWRIPVWLPPPVVPADNPMSEAKVELGRRLFYDKRLSRDGSIACASCHEQAIGFSDGKASPIGVTGERHPRNAMSLANVAYFPVLTWANPLLNRLESQALLPMFGESPVEMGMSGRENEMFGRIEADPIYPDLFIAAFPERRGAIDLGTITRAIATFERSLISANAPYDRFRYGGDRTALSEAAKRGERLFFSEQLECFHCHGGVHLSDNLVHTRKPFAEFGFHNTGLYNIGGDGSFPKDNVGLMEHTGRPDDMGRFRTPSLRNVAVSAPYMHDGSVETLRDVVDHYAAGGRTLKHGAFAGIGSASPLKSPFVRGFKLNDSEKDDLVAFLESLTDQEFLSDTRFSNPWLTGPNAAPNDRAKKFY